MNPVKAPDGGIDRWMRGHTQTHTHLTWPLRGEGYQSICESTTDVVRFSFNFLKHLQCNNMLEIKLTQTAVFLCEPTIPNKCDQLWLKSSKTHLQIGKLPQITCFLHHILSSSLVLQYLVCCYLNKHNIPEITIDIIVEILYLTSLTCTQI